MAKKKEKENLDTIETLGKLIPESRSPRRDAVHIAVMPVVAGEELRPGDKLRIQFGTADVVMCGEYNDDYVGRADPFLELAELKQEQIHAFGPDPLIPRCKGSMSAEIEST